MSKCAIIGVAGFIGSNIAERLIKDEHEVMGIDNLQFGDSRNLPEGFHFMQTDVADVPEWVLNTCDVMIISYCSNIIYAMDNEVETFKNNAITGIKICQRFKGKIINLGTSSIYNNATVIPTPETSELHTTNAYDSSKLILELFLEERKNFTTLRLSNVYSKNQRPDNLYSGVICKMIDSVLHDKPIKINGTGLSTRTYTHVSDVVDAVVRCIEQPSLNCAVNISGEGEINLIDLAKLISKCAGVELNIEYIPNRKIDKIDRRNLDISKAEKVLGWIPKTNLEEGIKRTIEWQKTL